MGADLSRWMFASAALRGRAHEATGSPCQDHAAGRWASGVAAIALADGAGSAAHSDIGARVVVNTALDLLTERFAEISSGDAPAARAAIVDTLRVRLEHEASARGVALRDLASTLLFVGVDGHRFVAGHIGDGVIGCERDGQLVVLSPPQRGEHLNETVFVTSSAALPSLALHRGPLDGHGSFVLMSDGSAESLHSRRTSALAPGARSIAGWLDARAPEQVDAGLSRALRDVIGPRTSDDCSVAILRNVIVPSERLPAMDAPFQQAFLACRTRRSLSNRCAVALALGEHCTSPSAIARRAAMSRGTARAHLQALRGVVRVGDAVLPGTDGHEQVASG